MCHASGHLEMRSVSESELHHMNQRKSHRYCSETRPCTRLQCKSIGVQATQLDYTPNSSFSSTTPDSHQLEMQDNFGCSNHAYRLHSMSPPQMHGCQHWLDEKPRGAARRTQMSMRHNMHIKLHVPA